MIVTIEIKTAIDGDVICEKELKIEDTYKDTICNLFREGIREYTEKICNETQKAILAK